LVFSHKTLEYVLTSNGKISKMLFTPLSSHVIFEGDALQVIKKVNLDRHCSSYYEHLVEDVKPGLRRLKSRKFFQVHHSANVVIHELAILARTHVIDVIR
jgi:hypothetical protein